MQDAIYVLVLIIAVVLGRIAYVGKKAGWNSVSDIKAYFWGSKEGKGILRGVVLGSLLLFFVGLLATSAKAQSIKVPGTFFNDASVYMALEQPKKVSPQCMSGGIDDRATSNLGARLNLWQSPSKDVRFNLQYTHHSCALNIDRNGYDAIGLQVEWFIWRRN